MKGGDEEGDEGEERCLKQLCHKRLRILPPVIRPPRLPASWVTETGIVTRGR